MTARFITLEGGDGAGKSTLLSKITDDLKNKNIPFAVTREPGGTPLAEEIRELLLKPNHKPGPLTELFLFEAARADHTQNFIRPKLEAGTSVLCDRYTHSSLVYQGYARSLGVETVEKLNALATQDLQPDLVLWLKLDPKIALKRLESRGKNRLDSEALDFHQRVFEAFSELAQNEPKRILALDASQSADAVFQELLAHPLWVKTWANHR